MIRDTLEALRHLLWPSRCASCDVLLDSPDAFLCEECRNAIRFCGRIAPPPSVENAFAFFFYEGAVQSMSARWKYHEDYCARLALLSCVSSESKKASEFTAGNCAVIPVPPHPRRLQERGFDPVWTLASKLTTLLTQNQVPGLVFLDESLKRCRHTVHQAGLDAEERAKNLREAFETVGEIPETVILVDDVVTTGATLTACAETLQKAGAKHIFAMTLACTNPDRRNL